MGRPSGIHGSEVKPAEPSSLGALGARCRRRPTRRFRQARCDVVGDALSDELVEEVVERTDGVPLFLEEVSRALLEANDASPVEDAAGRAARGETQIAVPATLNDTLLSRLDRDMHAKYVAQIASVIGRDFRLDALNAVAWKKHAVVGAE